MSITKEKQFIKLNYGTGIYTFDCATKCLLNNKGNVISKGSPSILKAYTNEHQNMTEWEKIVFLMIKTGEHLKELAPAVETLYSLNQYNEVHPDKAISYDANTVLDLILKQHIDISVKGYIAYCMKEFVPINEKSFSNFFANNSSKMLSGVPEHLIKAYLDIVGKLSGFSSVYRLNGYLVSLTEEKYQKIFIKILSKSNDWQIHDSIANHRIDDLLNAIKANETFIRTDEDIVDNCRTMEKVNRARSEAKNYHHISDNLVKIADIETIENDKYIIIVPKNSNDLILEGARQHNCIGSYYNRQIDNGRTLIYFIRKKDCPEKSYVTAQFDLDKLCTVQLKEPRNNEISPEVVFFVRSMIDPAIVQILAKKYYSETLNFICPSNF